MALEVVFVRHVAARHGYTEICHNETSRMISFRNGSTRINVYYTTGTVGTCLNHPKRGKSQLFRRNVDLVTLDQIFANPRIHTGTGYYHRKHITQKWKLGGSNNIFLNDSARRWQYLGETSGLFQIYPQDMQTVMVICTKWDSLYWDDGCPPDMHDSKYACGSHGGLSRMLYEVVEETCGICRCWSHVKDQYYDGGERPFDHICGNLIEFMRHHKQDVKRIKNNLMSLNKEVRIEMMQWLIGREACGFHFVDSDGIVIQSKWSDMIDESHLDYGRMAYPKKAGLCLCCGIVEHEGEN